MVPVFFKKRKKVKIVSPLHGRSICLEEVEDPVFANHLVGEGIAIIPSDDRLYTPADGEISVIAKTKHAIGLKLESGIELLIHIGIHTNCLVGDEFVLCVTEGQRVKQGDLLMTFDVAKLRQHGQVVVPIVVLHNHKHRPTKMKRGVDVIAKESFLFEV